MSVSSLFNGKSISQEDAVGLTFVGLAFIEPMATLSASNSSLNDERSADHAREALWTFRWQSWLTSAVLGVMSYAATNRSWEWGVATFLVGGITTELLHWDMAQVVEGAANGSSDGSSSSYGLPMSVS